ncbi:MAG: hypothetical protein JRH16_01280 [Deltaproteobacteria bacterium]|nr:hypothetical protein [Deltaproteobacteria bacterium]
MPEDCKDVVEIVDQVRERYELDSYRADRALVIAPFGQTHFHQALSRLRRSRALRKLAGEDRLLVLIMTSSSVDVSSAPDWVRCVQLDIVSGWPEPSRYQNRFIKWSLPVLLRHVERSIYVDSDLYIVGGAENISQVFEEAAENGFVIAQHNARSGWLAEYEAILRGGRYLSLSSLEAQRAMMLDAGVDPKGPVYQANYVARKHGCEFDALAWKVLACLRSYSERDQLALIWACHETGLAPFSQREGIRLLTSFTGALDREKLTFVDPNSLPHHLMQLGWRVFPLTVRSFFGIRVRRLQRKIRKFRSKALGSSA